MIQSREWIFLKLLLNTYFSAKQDVLKSLVPDDVFEKILSLPFSQKNPKLALSFVQEWCKNIHTSWFEDVLQTFSEPFQKYMENFLAKGAQDENLSKPINQFLCKYLYDHSKEKDLNILPRGLLTENPLSPLLDCSKKQLFEIVDLLAIFDLAEEVRYIVDKKILQGILQLLNEDQQKFLRSLLRAKSKLHMPQAFFQHLYSDEKKFLKALHKKGLQRLGCALSGYDQDFLWYFLHKLDVPRARYLETTIHSEAVPNTTHMIQLQIIQILQFLKSGSQ